MGHTTSKINLRLVTVPNKIDAYHLLAAAENEDLYLTECHDDRANSAARQRLIYVPNSISTEDNLGATTFFNGVIPRIPLRLLSDLNEVRIIQLMPSADGGMPHTRPGNIICCPNVKSLFSVSTLIHELWHVHQRNYQSIWLKVFNRLGWNVWTGTIPDKLENARRYNPDTIDAPLWIFNNKWVPLPIFNDITHPNVAEASVWFYNPSEAYHVKDIPEELAKEYPDLPRMAYEHPRELTAYMLSEPAKYSSHPAFTQLLSLIGQTAVMTSKNAIQ